MHSKPKKQIIDLQLARPFFLKHVEYACKRVPNYVHFKEGKYIVSEPLLAEYLDCSREVDLTIMDSDLPATPNDTPEDLSAVCLYVAARDFGRKKVPRKRPIEVPSPRNVVDIWRDLDFKALPETDRSVIVHRDERCEVAISFSKDTQELPALTIRLSGAPVVDLMRGAGGVLRRFRFGDMPSDVAIVVEAEQVLNKVVGSLRRTFGIDQLKPGRPRSAIGLKVAYLREAAPNSTWAELASAMCKKHDHSKNTPKVRACIHNLRTQGAQYWARIGRACR